MSKSISDLLAKIALLEKNNGDLRKENEYLRAENTRLTLMAAGRSIDYRVCTTGSSSSNLVEPGVEQLKLQLAQAKAAISIVDPATGTGAFLGNPPYGVRDGEG